MPRVAEIAARMAELDYSRKFFSTAAIRRDRDRYAAERRGDLARARREWQFFSDRSDIDRDIRGCKKLIANVADRRTASREMYDLWEHRHQGIAAAEHAASG